MDAVVKKCQNYPFYFPSMANNNHNLDQLSDEARKVTQEANTEPAFSGELLNEKRDGMYHCVVCNQALFPSDTKYESGTGWPSFSAAVNNDNLKLTADDSLGMKRTEVQCAKCGAHLGHVFDDGPTDKSADVPATGKRFCINSCALDFDPKQEDNE
jgi:peptide-methionine (R)-S-oxide reductase